MTLSQEMEKEVDRIVDKWDAESAIYIVPPDAIRAAMLAALEAAVQLCENEADEWGGPLSTSSDGKHSAEHCADAIRAMMKP